MENSYHHVLTKILRLLGIINLRQQGLYQNFDDLESVMIRLPVHFVHV